MKAQSINIDCVVGVQASELVFRVGGALNLCLGSVLVFKNMVGWCKAAELMFWDGGELVFKDGGSVHTLNSNHVTCLHC